ncbi:MAG TPA: DUF2760 domain-containing protein [Pirellulales bacterium]|jgi:hypothetical protein|nr:DUF2760 domain-containing protein [Pirellulales bacterium]
MHRIALAFRAFFRVLANALVAEQVERALEGQNLPAIEQKPVVEVSAPKPAKKADARNDALNLLAALQREARLVDFFQEPIAGYSDAQIGAAVRDIHRECAAAIERVFGLKQIESAAEGAMVDVPDGFDPTRIHLSGNVTGPPPFRGKLCHHGWEATRCDLPEWSGGEKALLVVAPAEVEIA